MLREERFELILSQLKKKNKVKFEDLALAMHVSEDTVRRDIEQLHRNGLLSKVRGGAMLREKDPLSFHDRQSFLANEKNIIALKAQQFIKDGMTVFMDGGTTIGAVANYMPLDIRLRVITNNTSLIPVLSKFKRVELILLGGIYDNDLAVTTGATTCNEASQFIADLFIMGTCAVDAEFGAFATSITDVETKRTMIKSSKKIIALANQNKLRRTEPLKICDLLDIDILITDLASGDQELDSLRNLSVQIV
ncbi:DeoR faimly transcriptional regulator [Chryseobacterium piperi]|uniref:DeoR faimly transcriptional regulator n=1 Tax=Chryseobacterium piperi TaxID=558152 RepID=A0A086BCR1_9FLAO|nr:DeoR/GlpR family DNA-binding transcription regulator [Chryseobacterium piperi]ASW73521.1 DeoR/GlpR transcriptional regulator [Chryseobacterium piperi]KFF26725.1 DeoR faimly transcriptional regulator [Chryseobacterium piperi]